MGRHARSTPRASSRGAGSTVDGPRARGSLRRGPDMVSSEARSRGNARASGAGWRVATHRQSDYGRPGARRLECRAMTTSSVFRLAAPAVMGALWVAGCGGGKSRSEERRVGKSVDLGGRRIIKKKKKQSAKTCRKRDPVKKDIQQIRPKFKHR